MKKEFIISFVVPFYKNIDNASFVLDNIIKFIGNSTQNIEVILINDSGDNSEFKINLNYVFPVKLINLKQNLGVTGARNVGYDNANGEYVFFFDSDDYLIPSKYDLTINFLNKNKYDVILFRCLNIKNELIGDPTLEVITSKSPNFYYGKGECLLAIRKSEAKPFIGFFRGNEHVGLLRYAILKYPVKFACTNFPIRIYTNNEFGLSSKINTPQRAFLMTLAHFLSFIFCLILIEPFWAFRFLTASFFRLIKLIKTFI